MNGQPTINGLADWTCRVWQAVFAVVRYVGGWTIVAVIWAPWRHGATAAARSCGWTIVAMLVERYLTTRRPQLARDYCSVCFVKVGLKSSFPSTLSSLPETDSLLRPSPIRYRCCDRSVCPSICLSVHPVFLFSAVRYMATWAHRRF